MYTVNTESLNRTRQQRAERELATMVEIAGRGPTIGARTTVAELLERWYAVASPGWAPTTVRQTRSVHNRRLAPEPCVHRVDALE